MIPRNAIIYRTPNNFTSKAFSDACANRHFTPCAKAESDSSGFVPPTDSAPDLMLRSIGPIHAFAFRFDTKLLPASIIKATLNERVAAIEAEQNRKVGRKELRDMKDDVTFALLQVAFTKTSIVRGWLDDDGHLLVIDTSSHARADEIIAAIFAGWPGEMTSLTTLADQTSPSQHFHAWIADGEAPHGLTIDDAGRFMGLDGEKIDAENVSLDDESMQHVTDGMMCIELALTHDDKISFRLTQTLAMKGIKLIGIDTSEGMQGDLLPEEKMDAELTVSAGLVRNAVTAIVDAVKVF